MATTKFIRILSVIILSAGAVYVRAAESADVFPFPREMRSGGGAFRVDGNVAAHGDPKLVRLLVGAIADDYGVALRPAASGTAVKGRAVVLGSIANPLVRGLAASHRLKITVTSPGPEGYVIAVEPDLVLVAGSDDAGAFYGYQTLRQLIRGEAGALSIAGVSIRDWPHKPFRGIKLYLPGRDSIPYFKRFVRDFMAAHKFNRLILEMNAAMRLDRHPEVNAGWLDLARDLVLTRRDRPAGPHGNMNSTHHDTADFGILEKDEVAELVRFVRDQHIEVIPEIPSLSHSYYLLARHPELAEVPEQWPDTYCPSLPGSYKLLFDVFDEYIDVMKPRMIHAGKDEWRMPWGVCPRCRNRDYREVFIEDLRKTCGHLRQRGVQMAMWGDHLIEPLRGSGLRPRTSRTGWKYTAPGAITPEQARTRVPKDILIFNWFWDEQYAGSGQGEKNDVSLEQWGFRQVYGNMNPHVQNYGRRSARKSVIGGAPSSWAATTEFNFGKDLLYSFLGTGNMMWSTRWPPPDELARLVQARVQRLRGRLGGVVAASELDPVTPVSIGAGDAAAGPGAEMQTGRIASGRLVFDVAAPVAVGVDGDRAAQYPLESAPVAVSEDASSLIFLHALARPAGNLQSYRYIYNFVDSADLLGWYEVVYEDGFVETIPLRYRVNILEWQRPRNSQSTSYCYGADAVDLSADPAKPVTFYAFEWRNPRLGKRIREIRLKGTRGFQHDGKPIPANTILLAGISIVKKRPFPPPVMPAAEAGIR